MFVLNCASNIRKDTAVEMTEHAKEKKNIITKSFSSLDIDGIDIFDDNTALSSSCNASSLSNEQVLRLDVGAAAAEQSAQASSAALHRAAATGRVEVLREAVAAAADPDVRDPDGFTALMLAAARGHAHCCQVLLEAGASPSQRCARGRCALDLAASGGNASALAVLLRHAPPSALRPHEALPHAARAPRAQRDCVCLLLEVIPESARCRVVAWLAMGARAAAERGNAGVLLELLLTPQGRRWRQRRARATADGLEGDVSCAVFECNCGACADATEAAVEAAARVGTLCLEDALLLLGAARGERVVAAALADPHATPRVAKSFAPFVQALSRGSSSALHAAAQAGCARALDLVYCCYAAFSSGKKFAGSGNGTGTAVAFLCGDLERPDANGFTPLQVSARAGAGAAAAFLLRRGARLAPALHAFLQQVPRAERRLRALFDDCVRLRTNQIAGPSTEQLLLRVGVLRPRGARRTAVLEQLFAARGRRARLLLRHPLVDAFIHVEWRRRRYALCVSLHFLTYALYLSGLAYMLLARPQGAGRRVLRGALFALSGAVLLAGLPFLWLGRGGRASERAYRAVTRAAPPLLAAAALALDYAPLGSFALIFSWMALLHYTNSVPVLSHKSAMFQYIMRKLADHIVVFVFVLSGFSLAFYLLYGDDRKGNFRDPWQSLLSTTLVLLQGGLDGTPLFKNGNQTTVSKDVQAAGGVMQQLFVVTAVLALLNMWVALAVRGGRELEDQGHLHYRRNQVQVLSVLEQLFSLAAAAQKRLRWRRWTPRDATPAGAPTASRPCAAVPHASSSLTVVLSDGDLPRRLASALRRIANRRRLAEATRRPGRCCRHHPRPRSRRPRCASASEESSSSETEGSDRELYGGEVHNHCPCNGRVSSAKSSASRRKSS